MKGTGVSSEAMNGTSVCSEAMNGISFLSEAMIGRPDKNNGDALMGRSISCSEAVIEKRD
jgi:hypothetical protein